MSPIKFELISENSLMLINEQDDIQTACIQLQALSRQIYKKIPKLINEQVPAYNRLLISYKQCTSQELIHIINDINAQLSTNNTSTEVINHLLPVCYDLSFGLDLQTISKQNKLSIAEIINRHSNTTYHVYALGFAPGFAYLGNVDKSIAIKRHASPRAIVPAGSVGIADRQTAIYPSDSPGGWHIVGRSPVAMFNINNSPACPIKVGDRVNFEPISLSEYSSRYEQLRT